MKNALLISLIFLSFTNVQYVYSQTKTIDSLRLILKKTKIDTTQINTLLNLAFEVQSTDPDEAILVSTKALKLSTANNWPLGIGQSKIRMGTGYLVKGNHKMALTNYFQAIEILNPLTFSSDTLISRNSERWKAIALNNIGQSCSLRNDQEKARKYFSNSLEVAKRSGFVKDVNRACDNLIRLYINNEKKQLYYLSEKVEFAKKKSDLKAMHTSQIALSDYFYVRANYVQALKNNLLALKTARKIDSKTFYAISLSNTGRVYIKIKKYSRAKKYLFMSLKIAHELKDSKMAADVLNYLGGCFSEQAETQIKKEKELLTSAIFYYKSSLKIIKKQNDLFGLSQLYGNLSLAFSKLKVVENAFNFAKKSAVTAEESGNDERIMISQNLMGSHFFESKNYQEAESYFKRSLSLSQRIGGIEWQNINHSDLSSTYAKLNDIDLAFYHYKKAVQIDRSINSNERLTALSNLELNSDLERKEEIAKIEHLKEIKRHEEKEQNQYVGIFSIIIILFTSLFLLNKTKVSAKRIDFIGFIGVLLFFQFIETLLHPYINLIAHGSPLLFMCVNICLASLIKPIHHTMEKRIANVTSKKKAHQPHK